MVGFTPVAPQSNESRFQKSESNFFRNEIYHVCVRDWLRVLTYSMKVASRSPGEHAVAYTKEAFRQNSIFP